MLRDGVPRCKSRDGESQFGLPGRLWRHAPTVSSVMESHDVVLRRHGLIGPGQNGKFRKRGRAGPVPVRSSRAGNSSSQNFSNFFEFFFPVPGRSYGFFWSNKTLFPKTNFFDHFFILTHPEPPPKPSYVPKKHPQTLKKNLFLGKKSKKSIIFDKIFYRPLFWSYGTWFWPSRSIENGFPIQMIPLWCKSELGNDDWCQNNVQHKFFVYKACFGPYRTLFWSYHSIENCFLILLI